MQHKYLTLESLICLIGSLFFSVPVKMDEER